MKFTLIQAAIETGKDRSTLFRAIKNGKLSAEKLDNGSYLIDSSELFRVYQAKQSDSATPKGATVELQQVEQGVLIDALKAQIELLKHQVEREMEQADHWRNQATMLLTHQPEKLEKVTQPEESLLWRKLFGRR